jgi:hypothetical protein
MTTEHLAPGARPPSHLRARQIFFLGKRYRGQLLLVLTGLLVLLLLRRRRSRARAARSGGR